LVGLYKVVRDDTEKYKSRKGAKGFRREIQNIFDYSPVPMWVLEMPSLKFLTVNQKAIDHYGYSREEFLSMTAYDIRCQSDQEKLRKVDRSNPINSSQVEEWTHLKKMVHRSSWKSARTISCTEANYAGWY